MMKTLADACASKNCPKLTMSESEILTSYNQAKNKKAQIGILADLNATNTATIRAILIDNGCILDPDTPQKAPPAPKPDLAPDPPAAKPARAPWTLKEESQLLELRGLGLTHREIGQKMGRTEHAVQLRYSFLTNKPESAAPASEPAPGPPAAPAPKKPTVNKDFEAAFDTAVETSAGDPITATPDKALIKSSITAPAPAQKSPQFNEDGKLRYALSLCEAAAAAFEAGNTASGCIRLGELLDHLKKSVFAKDKFEKTHKENAT